MFHLNDKYVLISGGAGLIGSNIAIAVSEAGATPIIADINKSSLLLISDKLKGKKHLCIESDFRNEKGIKNCIREALRSFPIIHSVVHAAYPRSEGWGNHFEDLDEENLKADLQSQLGASIILSKQVISHFLKAGGGNLVHISSIQGVMAPKFNHYEGTEMTSPIEYSAIKAGIISITRWLAKAYRNKNIRVNCISPGGIEDKQPKTFLNAYRNDCTNIGMLKPKDIADLVVYLLSDNSRAINGQNIIIDDGWTL